MSYRVNLYPREAGEWFAQAEFRHDQNNLKGALADISLHDEQAADDTGILVGIGRGSLTDDFGNEIAAMIRRFIEEITPVVSAFIEKDNEEEV